MAVRKPQAGTVPVPAVASGASSKRTLPNLPAHPAFRFLSHPERWAVKNGKVLPELRKLKLKDGINGAVRLDPKAPLNIAGALQDAAEAGYSVLSDDLGYCVGHRTSQGGVCYLERWQIPIPGSARIRVDEDDENEFYGALRAEIGEPPMHVLEGLLAAVESRLDAAQDKVLRKPSVRRLVERYQADRDVIQAEIDAQSKPKRTRTKKTAE